MKEDVVETVRRLGNGVLDMLQGRLELLQTELGDELDRLGGLLARQILVALSGLLTVQFLVLIVLALTWDTPWRVTAMILITLLAAGATALSYNAYTAHRQRRSPMFAASIRELEEDRRALERAT